MLDARNENSSDYPSAYESSLVIMKMRMLSVSEAASSDSNAICAAVADAPSTVDAPLTRR